MSENTSSGYPTGHIDPTSLTPTLALACDLISRPSVSPDDCGCQTVIAERLEKVGFTVEWINLEGVTNLWATHGEGRTLVFAGHTDVVPSGPETQWHTPPFKACIDDEGYLRGRGASDMKGSVASMVVALEDYVRHTPDHAGRLALLLTSDEEGPAMYGTREVVRQFAARGEPIDYCIVGEPSSTETVGDVIKNGRRGSMSGYLTVVGLQGHVAYPHKARNPIHMIAPVLTALIAEQWDNGNHFFPATTFQVSNIQSGTGTDNVVPGEAHIRFNFRFSTESTSESLQQRTHAIFAAHGLTEGRDYHLQWKVSGDPFLTEPGDLLNAAVAAVTEHTGKAPELSTSGGTSDGRFIATLDAQVIELGPVNATIHQVDERIRASELDSLRDMYESIIARLFAA